jgi:hypothetical protein
MPAGAQNELRFEQFRATAEAALNTISFIIGDIRTELVTEGVRMRTMWEEACGSCKSE